MFRKTTLTAVTLLMLGGCQLVDGPSQQNFERDPISLPYHFQVSTFLDMRPLPDENKALQQILDAKPVTPFREDVFLETLVKNINGQGRFERQPATLRIELLDYAALRDQQTYTASFYVDITGFTEQGHVLSTGKYSCFYEENHTFDVIRKVGNIFEHDQQPKRTKQRTLDTWELVYQDCLRQIAYDFNNKTYEWQRKRKK